MEVTVFDESMEMAPDAGRYFDAQDDIEIELDGVEAPGHDDDVIVDDASMAGSDHPGIIGDVHESVKDADMEDGGFHHDEGDHIETEEDYQFIDDALDIDHRFYEMEDDYEEDIDAPIPGTGVIEPNMPADNVTSAGMIEDCRTLENEPEGEVGTSTQAGPSEITPSAPKKGNKEVQIPSDIEQPESEVKEDDGKPEQAHDDLDPLSNREHLEYGEPGQEVKVPVEDLDEATYQTAEEPSVTRGDETENRESELPTLHNVQVLYQDSEISLFPPKQDDLSETYFLEDEALAHEPIGDLLSACRVVLGDHMGTEEELYMEIECLGLHLTETTRSPISLSQIVQVYLNLSHNDGDTNPGPLYISITTQPTFTKSFTALSDAAQAGKGLSHVGKWDEYEDQIVFEEHGNADSLQEEGQETFIEEVESSTNQPATLLPHPETEHEEVNDETYVKENLEINSNETKEEEAASAPAATSKEPEATNIEANKPEPEEVTNDSSGADESVEQEVTEMKTGLGQIEEPSHEDALEDESIQPPTYEEGGKPSVFDASQDTNTKHLNEVAPGPSEDFIEIELEGFEDEQHDDEKSHEEAHGDDDGLVDGDSTQLSYDQAAEPNTPEPTYNPLEVDEDIFKSPTAALADLPQGSLEPQDTGPPDAAAHPTEIFDEYQPRSTIPVDQNDEDTSEARTIPEEDQTQDFNQDEDVHSVAEEAQLERHADLNPEAKDLTAQHDDTFAGSPGLDVVWLNDAVESPDVASLEEPHKTELLYGNNLSSNDIPNNDDENTESALLEDESNGLSQNDATFQEQSPKVAKRPRVDDEPISISNPVPVIKKPRSE
ncbi:hypothetical protein McanMca71_005258 [Microsporum canis]